MKVTVKKQAAKKIKKGYPLIQTEDLKKSVTSNHWVTFVDETDQFLARGYLGKQNKGIGWVLTANDEPIDEAFFQKQFRTAKEKRRVYYQEEQTTAFRIVNGPGDHLGGLTIDLYENFAVFSWYNETLFGKKAEIIAAFQKIFPEVVGAYEKYRFGTGEVSNQLYGKKAPEPLLIKENNVSYAVYLDEGLMTGIFLDQKEVRGKLTQGLATGKKVLNMFSYTGAFSVAAAMGGATETTSVDLAKRSRLKTEEQFSINGLSSDQQKIYVMDTFAYFNYAKKKNLTFDLVILDPPSFARNKKKVFSVAKDYGSLIENSVDILSEKGMILASTNAENLSVTKFRQTIETSLINKGVSFECVQSFRLPSDYTVSKTYPEGNYLKVFLYQIEK